MAELHFLDKRRGDQHAAFPYDGRSFRTVNDAAAFVLGENRTMNNLIIEHPMLNVIDGLTAVRHYYVGAHFRNIIFKHCNFIGCDFSEAKFTNCSFQGCRFSRCYLPGLLLEQCYADSNTVIDRPIGGAVLDVGSMQIVRPHLHENRVYLLEYSDHSDTLPIREEAAAFLKEHLNAVANNY